MSYMGPKIGDILTKDIKQVATFNELKAKSKIWK